MFVDRSLYADKGCIASSHGLISPRNRPRRWAETASNVIAVKMPQRWLGRVILCQ